MNLIILLIIFTAIFRIVKIIWGFRGDSVLSKLIYCTGYTFLFLFLWMITLGFIANQNPAEYVGTKIVQSEYVRGMLISDKSYKELPIVFSQGKKVIFERVEPISINKNPNFWTFPFFRIYKENYWNIKEIK